MCKPVQSLAILDLITEVWVVSFWEGPRPGVVWVQEIHLTRAGQEPDHHRVVFSGSKAEATRFHKSFDLPPPCGIILEE